MACIKRFVQRAYTVQFGAACATSAAAYRATEAGRRTSGERPPLLLLAVAPRLALSFWQRRALPPRSLEGTSLPTGRGQRDTKKQHRRTHPKYSLSNGTRTPVPPSFFCEKGSPLAPTPHIPAQKWPANPVFWGLTWRSARASPSLCYY
jgi:hypothetical protein